MCKFHILSGSKLSTYVSSLVVGLVLYCVRVVRFYKTVSGNDEKEWVIYFFPTKIKIIIIEDNIL